MTKNEIDPLLMDLEIIIEKLNNTTQYVKSLKDFFEKEVNKCRRKRKMNE